MTLALMRAVYLALSNGMPDVNVTRAWAQTPVSAPSCSFRLHAYKRREDGSDLLTLQVVLRASLQEMCDTYSAQAVTALAALSYFLVDAADEQENVTGSFLRVLTLAAVINPPPDAAETTYPLLFRVYYDPQTALTLPSPVTLSITPARREAISTVSFSNGVYNLPAFAPGRIIPAVLRLSCPWSPTNAAIEQVRNAFKYANDLKIDYRFRFADFVMNNALVTAFHASPLGVDFSLTLRSV